jgi:hypothetical protein
MAANRPMTFRSTTALVVGVVWLLFAVGNWIDLAIQGRDHGSVVAAAVLLLATGIAYVTALRPRILADDAGITIRNPLRDHRIGWGGVAKVDLSDVLRVHCEWTDTETHHQVISAWAVHHSRRRQSSGEARARRAASRRSGYRNLGTPHGAQGTGYASTAAAHVVSPAEQAASVLNERATHDYGKDPKPPVSAWNRTAIAALVVPALILLVVLLVP